LFCEKVKRQIGYEQFQIDNNNCHEKVAFFGEDRVCVVISGDEADVETCRHISELSTSKRVRPGKPKALAPVASTAATTTTTTTVAVAQDTTKEKVFPKIRKFLDERVEQVFR